MSIVEGQSTAGLAAIATSATAAGSSDTVDTARQLPIDIETAAATSPTPYSLDIIPVQAVLTLVPNIKLIHVDILVKDGKYSISDRCEGNFDGISSYVVCRNNANTRQR